RHTGSRQGVPGLGREHLVVTGRSVPVPAPQVRWPTASTRLHPMGRPVPFETGPSSAVWWAIAESSAEIPSLVDRNVPFVGDETLLERRLETPPEGDRP